MSRVMEIPCCVCPILHSVRFIQSPIHTAFHICANITRVSQKLFQQDIHLVFSGPIFFSLWNYLGIFFYMIRGINRTIPTQGQNVFNCSSCFSALWKVTNVRFAFRDLPSGIYDNRPTSMYSLHKLL